MAAIDVSDLGMASANSAGVMIYPLTVWLLAAIVLYVANRRTWLSQQAWTISDVLLWLALAGIGLMQTGDYIGFLIGSFPGIMRFTMVWIGDQARRHPG